MRLIKTIYDKDKPAVICADNIIVVYMNDEGNTTITYVDGDIGTVDTPFEDFVKLMEALP